MRSIFVSALACILSACASVQELPPPSGEAAATAKNGLPTDQITDGELNECLPTGPASLMACAQARMREELSGQQEKSTGL
jgi:hypothetical protein